MSATASDPFFWNDWQGDPRLRACGHSAQGVWMRLLCIAAESSRKGYVLLNGVAPTIEELVPVIGGTLESVSRDVGELEKWGVFSRDRHQIIYCRRMVRAEKKRLASAKGGKKGGRVSASNKTGIHATPITTPEDTPPVTTHPKARASSSSFSSSNLEVRKKTLSAGADLFAGSKPKKPRAEYPPEFEEFWKCYSPPKNAKKPDALKAWGQVADIRPPRAEMLRAVAGYREWLSEQTRKRKSEYPMQHPATFLRERVWENYLGGGAEVVDLSAFQSAEELEAQARMKEKYGYG